MATDKLIISKTRTLQFATLWRVVLIVSALANEMDIWQLLNSTSIHYELNRKRKCKTVNTKIQNFFIFVQNKIHVLHFCGVKENTLIA